MLSFVILLLCLSACSSVTLSQQPKQQRIVHRCEPGGVGYFNISEGNMTRTINVKCEAPLYTYDPLFWY